MTATRGIVDICEVTGAKGYGINHDGSNPHFLGLQNARDIDAPVRRRPDGAEAFAEKVRIDQALDQLERDVKRVGVQAGKSALGKTIL